MNVHTYARRVRFRRSALIRRAVALLSIVAITASCVCAPLCYATPSNNTVAQASARMNSLSAELEAAGNELAQIEEEVEATRAEIAAHQERIANLKDELAAAQDGLSACVRESYINGTESYISVLLGSSTFSDFTSRLFMVERVASDRANTINNVLTLSSEIDEESEALNDRLAEQESLLAQAQARTASVQAALSEQQQIIDSLTAEELAQVNANNDTGAASDTSISTPAAVSSQSSNNGNSNSSTSAASNNASSNASNNTSSSSSSSASSSASLPAAHSNAASVAYGCLGIPYLWGGTTTNGFDCSGLVQWCYRQIGISIPRTTYSQWTCGTHVNRSDLQAGDLVFFGSDLHHVGIYIGGGQYIHAPQTGDVVKISNLSSRGDYAGAVRP